LSRFHGSTIGAYQARPDAGAVERLYNATRRHSTIGYLSAIEFKQKVGLA